MKVVHFMRKPDGLAFSVERVFEDVRRELPADIDVDVYVNPYASRGIWRRLLGALRAACHQSQVNHITGDVHFLNILMHKNRTLLTVHDCVTLERLSGLRYTLFRFFWYWLPARRSAAITVVSKFTKQELQKHLGRGNWSITVIPNPVSPEFSNAPKVFNSNFPTILQVGTTINKNIERVAAALNGLQCKIVIVGKLLPEQLAALHKNNIVYENCFGITQAELADLYRQCDIVMFASLYEGFGLPILEAQATGRPVITSNCYSMPEVGGEGACYVDPYTVSDIRQVVQKIVSDADYREQIVRAGQRNVEKYQATTIARQYAELYRRVHKGEAA
jgi:glycosyltransferase involved in cell wall biosynthesis